MDRPLAVVTEASNGIGLELSKVFVENGYDLIIAACSEEIYEAKRQLESLGAKVKEVRTDLSGFKGVERLFEEIKKSERPIDAIAINAGLMVGGSFLEADLDDEIRMINLNIISAVHLTKRVLPLMLRQHHGRILYTSSIASKIPVPSEAVYSASKAFFTSFADGIREECRDFGIYVTVLIPGPKDTSSLEKRGMEDGPDLKYENDPHEVAQEGFDAMMAGKELVVGSRFRARMVDLASRLLPENWMARAQRLISETSSTRH